jgi:hypothetical protein
MVVRDKTQERTMHTKSKNFIAVALGTVLAPALIQSASAERLDARRESAIRECMALQNRESHDPFDEIRGGVQFHYKACMANHGQPE